MLRMSLSRHPRVHTIAPENSNAIVEHVRKNYTIGREEKRRVIRSVRGGRGKKRAPRGRYIFQIITDCRSSSDNAMYTSMASRETTNGRERQREREKAGIPERNLGAYFHVYSEGASLPDADSGGRVAGCVATYGWHTISPWWWRPSNLHDTM